ncbi:ABC transporter substrate-binding protein, partial [Mesorhizobium sp. M7A.F.Ca.CA.002.09.1.1]
MVGSLGEGKTTHWSQPGRIAAVLLLALAVLAPF